jgi:uncharacterized protein
MTPLRGTAVIAAAIFAGALFATGLVISGMTNPQNVLGFLNIFGSWNPNLALVMASAIAVYAPIAYLVRRRESAVLSANIHWPTQRNIDRRLVSGAALFGIGWGLSGYCPGPALVAIAGGKSSTIWFVAAMSTAMIVFNLFQMSRPSANDSQD